MSSLAERDKLIDHLQDQINAHKNFLGGGIKLSAEEKDKLITLETYLKEYGGSKSKKDLDTIHSLLTQ